MNINEESTRYNLFNNIPSIDLRRLTYLPYKKTADRPASPEVYGAGSLFDSGQATRSLVGDSPVGAGE